MKIKILGSGGGEAYPSAFCSCANCEMARKNGGKNIRSLSQTLVNDDLLIDFPADTSVHCAKHAINLGAIENALITHAHLDHYFPMWANLRRVPFAHDFRYDEFRFYGPKNLERIYDQLTHAYSEPRGLEHVVFSVMEAGQVEQIGVYKRSGWSGRSPVFLRFEFWEKMAIRHMWERVIIPLAILLRLKRTLIMVSFWMVNSTKSSGVKLGG